MPRSFGAPDAAGFLKQVQLIEKHAGDSQALKQAVSSVARVAESTVEAFGGESALLKTFGPSGNKSAGRQLLEPSPTAVWQLLWENQY